MTGGICLFDRRLPPPSASDVARPSFISPQGSDAHPLRVSDDANEALRGCIPPDCGDVEPRLASDIAAFLARHPQDRPLDQRNRLIVRLVHGGSRLAPAGRPFGISEARVCQIYGRSVGAEKREQAREIARRTRLAARADTFLAWQATGLSLSEIGARLGVSGGEVGKTLRTHPDYVPAPAHRLPGGWPGVIPGWVSAQHHDRFRRLAGAHGEEAAATCLHKLKILEKRYGAIGPALAHQTRASHDAARAA